MSSGPATIVWFRRDLRVADHPALRTAVERGPTVCLFVLDPGILGRRHHQAPARLRFLRLGLEMLDAELAKRGSRLVVRHGMPEAVLREVAGETGADRVAITREISPLGRRRDERIASALEKEGVALVDHGGALAAEPDDLPGGTGEGYLVFTPFYKAWQQLPLPAHVPAPAEIAGPRLRSMLGERVGPADAGWAAGALPDGEPPLEAGPLAARQRLVDFITSGAADRYGRERNALADEGTSRLSAYLRLGMVTPAQIGRALGLPDALSGGRAAFWRQVCWRDFYHHHLARHPEVARTALRPAFREIRWEEDEDAFDAWRQGRTGVPVVDAAMRQLAQTGWIHNRGRLIVGSFLVKDLLIDWRRGESHFMQGLVDGDPANNNGGWQWMAGTGTDAAPYFRVLNPVVQGKRHDPEGEYVRRYVAELREVPIPRIHEPWTMTVDEQRDAGCVIGEDYPAPIVDHQERRAAVIQRFKDAKEAYDARSSSAGAP